MYYKMTDRRKEVWLWFIVTPAGRQEAVSSAQKKYSNYARWRESLDRWIILPVTEDKMSNNCLQMKVKLGFYIIMEQYKIHSK